MRGTKKIIISLSATLFSLIFGNQAVFASSNISISLSSDLVSLNLVPGIFGSASQTITASTTSTAGYTINFQNDAQSTALIHTEDNSLTIPTLTLPAGSTSIPASSLNNSYGYSLDNGTSYLPISGSSTTEIFRTSTAGENTHTLTFGAKPSIDTAAGAYTKSFTIYAVANLDLCPAENICYYGNNDDGSGVMENQSVSPSTDTATLIASNFSRQGYGFAGWNTEPDGSGVNYGPNQTITTGDLSVTGLQLYAKWVASVGNLQNWNGCDAMSIGDIIALTDTRDNNTYAVAKYADKKCWMMENLRLDLSKSSVEINNDNTNRPTSAFTTTISSHPASSNSFCETFDTNCIDHVYFNTNNTNRNLTASYDANNAASSWYSYGNYYNWYTATAGNGTYNSTTAGSVTNGDLCPASWHLPTGYGSKSEFALLDKAIGGNGANHTEGNDGVVASARWRSYPINYIYSGEQRGNTGYNRNISGGYTTSNTSNADRSLNLWLRPIAINLVGNSNLKNRGQTIRCIASGEYSATGNIRYNSNGGSGVMADEENVDFTIATAANNSFSKNHAEFVSWNTRADGTGIVVTEGGIVTDAAKSMSITDGDTLVLYAIWRPIYTIRYDKNGVDATGSMDGFVHYDPDNSNPITLIASNFSRQGYGFAGWSLDANAASKIANGTSVSVYGPNERIYLSALRPGTNADADNYITLYAVWLPADTTNTLQTFGASACNALSVGDILALTDTRDNNTYTIAKLKDNNCWMTENLRLVPSSVTFSTTNTNSPTDDFISGASSSGTSNTLCGLDESSCVDTIAFNSNNINRGLTPSYNGNDNYYSWYSYGVLYNWHTASAGRGTSSMQSGSVSGDICPSGWRLPTGGNNSDFSTLSANNSNSSNNLRKYPNNFVYSGDFNKTASGGRGSYSRYWSATASNATSSFRLGIGFDDVTPLKAYNKWDAFAVRCIVKSN